MIVKTDVDIGTVEFLRQKLIVDLHGNQGIELVVIDLLYTLCKFRIVLHALLRPLLELVLDLVHTDGTGLRRCLVYDSSGGLTAAPAFAYLLRYLDRAVVECRSN